MAVSKRLRYEILRRDNHTCRYCGATAPDAKLTVDHVTPTALGGTDTPDNLVTACEPCNSGKTSTPADVAIVADVAEDAARWARAWQQAARQQGEESKSKGEIAKKVKARLVRACKESYGRTPTIPSDAAASVIRWVELGLPIAKINELADYTVSRRNIPVDGKWRYFAGCCWSSLREIEARTRELLDDAGQPPTTVKLNPVGEAALLVWAASWEADFETPVTSEELESMRAKLLAFYEEDEADDVPADRLIKALEQSIWHADPLGRDIADVIRALGDEERFEAVIAWADAWAQATGEAAPNSYYTAVDDQIKALVERGTVLSRAAQSALVAGSRGSAILHFGLHRSELEAVGTAGAKNKILDVWTSSFAASAGRQPDPAERREFLDALERVGDDGGYWVADAVAAAAAAGAYEDPNLLTCLSRHGSVFEAAAHLCTPASN
jgi:hypothetical protein